MVSTLFVVYECANLPRMSWKGWSWILYERAEFVFHWNCERKSPKICVPWLWCPQRSWRNRFWILYFFSLNFQNKLSKKNFEKIVKKNFNRLKGDVIRVEISMGCKQPEACYANKKQNFLVRAGRQCFPKNSMSSTLAYGIDSVSCYIITYYKYRHSLRPSTLMSKDRPV